MPHELPEYSQPLYNQTGLLEHKVQGKYVFNLLTSQYNLFLIDTIYKCWRIQWRGHISV